MTTTEVPHSKLIPDPERRERRYTVISVDDHLVEPPHMFENRMPKRFVDRAPRVLVNDDGSESWLVDGTLLDQVGFNALAGRELPEEGDTHDPVTFAEMRRSAWDIRMRVADMDLDGIYASVCFPSFIAGFGGIRLETTSPDRDYSFALMQAWNDWNIEEWCGSFPERMIPCQLTWLHDPEIAAKEVERNAERGFKAVTFPESPHLAGFPSLHVGYWDPLIRACAETDTVMCVHTGSAGKLPEGAPDAPADLSSALFGAGYSLTTTVDWLYSRYPVKFPNLKIVITEGGIGWVPSLLDRLDHHYVQLGDRRKLWTESDLAPADVLKRNFFFCLLDEPSAMIQLDRMGPENILYETDFPHGDASWPNTHALLDRHFKGTGVSPEVACQITWQNASKLFNHPVPEAVQDDPDAY